jgi:hypothetical protein
VLEDDVFHGVTALYWVLIAGVLAYAASYFARGWLAGHQWFALYGGLVFMESFSRLLFAVAVAIGIASGQTAVAVGMAAAIEVLEHVPDPAHTVAEMARVARGGHLLVSVPREPLWRGLNLARGAYVREWGNTPGHVNHWSRRGFVVLLSRHGDVAEVRSPFPWTMLLVRA